MKTVTEREKCAIFRSYGAGLVPEIGLHHLAVGRKAETEALCRDIDAIRAGGGACRFIKGPVGSGKTFLENLARVNGLGANLVVAQADFTVDHRLNGNDGRARGLYTKIMTGLSTKSSPDGNALPLLIETWLSHVAQNLDPKEEFGAVIYKELRPLREHPLGAQYADVLRRYYDGFHQDDLELQDAVLKWLRGEFGTKTEAREALGLKHCQIITDADVYPALKVFARFCRIAGYDGFYVILDELGNLCDRLPNARARQGSFAVLHTIVDEAFQGKVQGVGFLFAGTQEAIDDPDRGLLSYAPLRSRLRPANASAGFSAISPVIPLAPLGTEEVFVLLRNILRVQSLGDPSRSLIPEEGIQEFMELAACAGTRVNGNPRDIVRPFVELLTRKEAAPDKAWTVYLTEYFARDAK